MITISAKAKTRLTAGLKKYQPVLAKARENDINESDTVTIITDILCDVLGYDKYENITSEFAIKKTFCDLAIKLGDKIPLLIECKAAGIDLKDDHVRQATNYAADSGIEWVALTNGVEWRIYKVMFTKPIDKKLVYSFDFCSLSGKKEGDLEMLYCLAIESLSKTSKNALDEIHAQKQVLNKFVVGQLLVTDTALDSLRKLIKKLFPEVKTTNEALFALLSNDVIKRDIIEGEDMTVAKKTVQKAERQTDKSKAKPQAE